MGQVASTVEARHALAPVTMEDMGDIVSEVIVARNS